MLRAVVRGAHSKLRSASSIQRAMSSLPAHEVVGMPALSPIEFHVARRISDNDPVIAAIFEQASALRLGPEGEG